MKHTISCKRSLRGKIEYVVNIPDSINVTSILAESIKKKGMKCASCQGVVYQDAYGKELTSNDDIVAYFRRFGRYCYACEEKFQRRVRVKLEIGINSENLYEVLLHKDFIKEVDKRIDTGIIKDKASFDTFLDENPEFKDYFIKMNLPKEVVEKEEYSLLDGNYYELLGVSKSASKEEIIKRFNSLSENDKKNLREVYNILVNDIKRDLYDSYL